MNLKFRKIALGAILVATLAGTSSIVRADQTSDKETLQQQIQQPLDQPKKQSDVKAGKCNAKPKFDLQVSGLLQVNAYPLLSGDDGKGRSLFYLRRGKLKLVADVGDRLQGVISLDIAKTEFGGADNNIKFLQDAYLSYLLSKNASSRLYADVGQFKIPVGYESLISSTTLPLLERSMIYAQGKYGDVRDTGAQLRGSAGKIKYWLGAFKGLGEHENGIAKHKDDRALAGRILWHASHDVTLGTSAAKSSNDERIVNGFAAYNKKDFWLSGEYTKGSSGSGGTIKDGHGSSLTAGYHFSPKWEGVTRYDRFDDANKGTATEWTLGVNYYIKSYDARIQVNIVKHEGPVSGSSGYRSDWTELRTGFQVPF